MMPLTETYNHIGSVQRAIRLCVLNLLRIANHAVISTIGKIIAASITWEASSEKYR